MTNNTVKLYPRDIFSTINAVTILIALVLLILIQPYVAVAYVGFGGYSSEKTLGSLGGTEASLYLGEAGDELIVLGEQGEVPDSPPAPTPSTDTGSLLLKSLLPILVASGILISVLIHTGNPLTAMVSSIIGLITFYIAVAMLELI